jgi:mannose-6-phosphate isomerase-like protein (cupin superfamily)
MKKTLSPLIAYKRGRSLDSSKGYMSMVLTFLAESKDTGGRFALIEGSPSPGTEPPPHVHEREDELFYILEGEIDAYIGNEVFKVSAGECLFLPKLKPHTFIVRSPRCRSLVLFVPGGLDGHFRARSSPAEKLELPTGTATYSTSNLEPVIRAFKEYGVRFLSLDEVAEQMPLYFAALNETNSLASISGSNPIGNRDQP